MDQSSKKQDIILQLGSQWIRVGLVGDRTPRKSLKTNDSLKIVNGDQKQQKKLQQLLYNIFFSYVSCSCQGKTVIILQKVYTDRRILQAIAKILFLKLKIFRLQFALSCVTPLYLSGRYTGLIVSAGASMIQIMPIYQGYPIFKAFQCLSVGTINLNTSIKQELMKLNPQINPQIIKQIPDWQINEALKIPFGALPASQQPVNITLKSRYRVKWVPKCLSYKCIYGDPLNEQNNIAYSFLHALTLIPDETIQQIAGNIILAGGFWRIKGMQKYFKFQISNLFQYFPQLVKNKIKQKLGFVNWNFNPSQIGWIGCSIGSSIRSIQNLSLKRNQYQKTGFSQKVMKTYFLSN